MSMLQYFQRFDKESMGNIGFLMHHTIGDEKEKDVVERSISKYLGLRGCMHALTCTWFSSQILCLARASAVAGFLKGFGAGFILKAAHGLFFRILKGKKDSVFRSAASLGLFLGTMICAARGVESGLNKLNMPPKLSSIIAGFISGLSSILFPSVDIALYAFVKALDAVVRALIRGGVLPNLAHGVELLFAIQMGFAYYAVCFETNTVRRSFWNFLQIVSGGRRTPFLAWSKLVSHELGIPILNDNLIR